MGTDEAAKLRTEFNDALSYFISCWVEDGIGLDDLILALKVHIGKAETENWYAKSAGVIGTGRQS